MNKDHHRLTIDEQSIIKILDFLPYPFLISEEEEGVRYNKFVNKKFKEEIGYDLSDIKTIDDWFTKAYPDVAYREEISKSWSGKVEQAIRHAEDSVMMRAKIFTRFSTYQWYEVKSSFKGATHFVAFVNINDVIERDMELERMNENKNKMLSILGHDLRSPIANLNTLSEYALHLNLDKGEFMEYLTKLHEISKASLQFLETTLIWTKNNFEKINPVQNRIILKELIEPLLKIYESDFYTKHISVNVDIPDDLTIFSDEEVINIVLRNLISNALKFTPENGEINLIAEKENHHVSIVVKDSGIGMDSQFIEDIVMDKFEVNKVSRTGGGFGIGLRLCKEVLTQIGGKLDITSQKNQGTTVTVRLPG